MANIKNKKTYIRLIGGVLAVALFLTGYFLVRAASLSVTETFDNPEKIASKSNMTICGGQIKLAEETWTTLSECTCNALDGWYWYETNGRGACWSKTLADSVSWNKGVGDDTDNPGAYTCATDVTALKDRMVAASAGEWYKLVSNVNSVTITSSHNGSAGYSVISALAISDCVDGTRDLCTGDGCLGADVSAVNVSLQTWALDTSSKAALPYCSDGACGTAAASDYRNACEQNSSDDYPVACYDGLFNKNHKTCGDGDSNYVWASTALGTTSSRYLGDSSCSSIGNGGTSNTSSNRGFRVVVRP
jgi:hypothetical protein